MRVPLWSSLISRQHPSFTRPSRRRMPVLSLTDEQIRERVSQARELAKQLNALLQRVSIRELGMADKVQFVINRVVAEGKHGVDGKHFLECTKEWATGGAIEQLMNLLDKDTPGNVPQFGAGDYGSVWFDTHLTGGEGENRRTMLVRVIPSYDVEGKWNIMLDNTLVGKW